MFCTKCGIELREQDKFCSDCGTFTGKGAPPAFKVERLTRSVTDVKIAGVCAGFARYFGVDVTLVRVVWLALTVWPLPLFGAMAYFVAWIVMPKDPVAIPEGNMHPANGSAT
jgi:phage shock protein C